MKWWEPYAMLGQQPPVLEIVPLGPSEADLRIERLINAVRATSEAGHLIYFPPHPGKVTL